MKIEIIENREDWNEFLSLIDAYDCYHTYDYHLISKSKNEIPILLKYEHLDVLIGIPFLVRFIYNTDYKDLTSVYGYPGPISKGLSSNFDNTQFKKELVKFLKLNNFVSVFSRLNPYIENQSKILLNLGSKSTKGKVVNIDITQSLEIQRANYQNRLKTYINKSRKSCSVRKVTTKEDLKAFIDIYHENMKRVGANDIYFFKELYFQNLIDSKEFQTEILLAIDNDSNKIIAGSMFIITNGIVQHHLSGSKQEFLSKNPVKLLIDEMRIIATNKNYKTYNLGGGLGGSEDDSLFKFKSTFSKDHKNFNS